LISDDEIATTGPLARYVSTELSLKAMSWHRWLGDVLLILVAIHILAVVFHVFVKKESIVRAMFDGNKRLPPELAQEASAARKASTSAGVAVVSIAVVAVIVAVNWSSWFAK
jgi:predicted ferric reductase